MTDRHIRDAHPTLPLRRLISAAAVALGLAPGPALAEPPRSVAPHAAPKAWLDYAAVVSEQVQARLASDDPVAQRLRGDLTQLPDADTPDGVKLKISFWIDPTGVVARVDFRPFARAEPNDDLNALLVGFKLPEPPPKDMVLPLRLTIQLKPKDQTKPEPQAWNGRWSQVGIAVRAGYGGGGPAVAPAFISGG